MKKIFIASSNAQCGKMSLPVRLHPEQIPYDIFLPKWSDESHSPDHFGISAKRIVCTHDALTAARQLTKAPQN